MIFINCVKNLIIKKLSILSIYCLQRGKRIVTEKHIDFKVNYKKLNIFEEYNTKDMAYPIVLSSPHSGKLFPQEFLENCALSEYELRSSEDCFVDEIILEASNAGIPMIAMNIPRTFVDVNRDKIEIDETMYFDCKKPQDLIGSRRCRVGLGVIHRIVSQNKAIYDGLISHKEVMERIKYVYEPYHKRLKQLIDKCYRKFGFCLLIDCHSMPSKICNIMNEAKPVEFCVCTLFDESCPTSMSEFFGKELANKDYRVEYNRPYAGAFITFNYCQPRKNIFTLQLEINRSLYMIEETYKKNVHFQDVSKHICDSIINLGKFLLDFKK